MGFDVLRLDLPLGDMRDSEKIWNHVDESASDPRLTALLARNGLRLGLADESAWPAMRAVFEAHAARSLRRQHYLENGLALMVDLGRIEEGDAWFVHGVGGALRGGTFHAGTRVLRIDYALAGNQPAQVDLRVVLEVREDDTQTRLVAEDGEIRSLETHTGPVFHELGAALTLHPGQFLVVGPSDRADNRYLLGGRWFTSELEMQTFETVLCVTPQPVRVE